MSILEKQTIRWPLVAIFIKAIQQRHQYDPLAREYDAPNCHHTRRLVEKWVKGMIKQYGN